MARIRKTHEPSTILLEDWFIEHVLLQPHVAGALRSLLGKDVALPVLVSHHGGVSVPGPPQGWHQVRTHPDKTLLRKMQSLESIESAAGSLRTRTASSRRSSTSSRSSISRRTRPWSSARPYAQLHPLRLLPKPQESSCAGADAGHSHQAVGSE